MKVYELTDDINELISLNLGKSFYKKMLNKYENLELQDDGLLSILSFEIKKHFPICKHDEYIKKIFSLLLSNNCDVNMQIKLAEIFNENFHDTQYKTKLYNFLLSEVITVFEHIKLFDLHRKMFDTNNSLIQMEEEVLLNEIEKEDIDSLELFLIGISYNQINRLKKANRCIEGCFNQFKKIKDINKMNNIIYKIQEYCRIEKDICFRQGDWLTTFDDKLFKIFRSHKDYEKFHSKRSKLYEQLL